jgi:hypothetical protein
MSLNTNVYSNEKLRKVAYIKADDEKDAQNHSTGMFGEYYEKDDEFYYLSNMAIAVILASLTVDMGNMTEKNFPQWVKRIRTFEMIKGGFLYKDKENIKLELADLYKFIGFSSNVSTLSDAKFKGKTNRWINEEVEPELREFNNQKEKA